MSKQIMVEVPVEWLEELYKHAKKALETEDRSQITVALGYAISAITQIKKSTNQTLKGDYERTQQKRTRESC